MSTTSREQELDLLPFPQAKLLKSPLSSSTTPSAQALGLDAPQEYPPSQEADVDTNVKFLGSLIPRGISDEDDNGKKVIIESNSVEGSYQIVKSRQSRLVNKQQEYDSNVPDNQLHTPEPYGQTSATISVAIPLLQYDFRSTQSSPTVQAQTEGPAQIPMDSDFSLDNEYTYLKISPYQTRLLRLSKGRKGEVIHCSLKEMMDRQLRQTHIVYQALSYAWGPENDPIYDIFLRDIEISLSDKTSEESLILASHQVIPRRFYIRSNLYHALQQLRSETEDLWFWIDAICIDQQNNVEKTHQLGKMLDIYSSADNVCIWIGDSDLSSRAMSFIPSIIDLRMLDRMVSGNQVDEDIAACCCAFAKLLRQPWFGRRWVIQEVAAAQRASIQCGKKAVNWIDFSDAADLFITNIGGIRNMYRMSANFKVDPNALDSVESSGAKAIVSCTNGLLRKAQNGKILDRLHKIEALVMTFLHFEASDPRDTVYALLGLAYDGHFSTSVRQLPTLVPDYTRRPVQTYIEFVRHCVISGESLDLICRHWALRLPDMPPRQTRRVSNTPTLLRRVTPLERLPSWIGPSSDSPFGPPTRFTGRLNGDSFVGQPGQAIYNSSRGRRMVARFGEQPIPPKEKKSMEFEYDGTLTVAGMVIGRVSRVTSRVIDGIISDDCLEIAGWTRDDNVNKVLDRVWRMLVADRSGDGQSPPSWYRRACMYCLNKTSPDGDLNTAKLISNASLPNTVLEFLKRVQSVVWSRKFIVCRDLRTTSAELFGLGPRYTKEGDLITILYGCSVPVVLRPADRNEYELVGECYIYGHMEGESIATMEEAAIEDATVMFTII